MATTTINQFIVDMVTGPTVGKKKRHAVNNNQVTDTTPIGLLYFPNDLVVTGNEVGVENTT